MAIKRIHPYVETDDLDGSRSFYTEMFGVQVAMAARHGPASPGPDLRAGHRLPERR